MTDPMSGGITREAVLLDLVQKSEDLFEMALLRLIQCYARQGQADEVIAHGERLVALVVDPEKRATLCLRLGGELETLGDFEAAVAFYRRILPLEPAHPVVWYFAHNNLGYSLVQLGRFEEAEGYCRRAIEINPSQYNAHKNLGLALAWQQQYLQAAESLIVAARLEPRDLRALRHLDELLGAHPEVFEGQPHLAAQIERCRRMGGVG